MKINLSNRIQQLTTDQKDIAPLVSFRILFGLVMLYSAIRFVASGWVERLYIEPEFFFKFYGFEWVEPLGTVGMYAVFGVIALSALFIALGLFYRLAAIVFFLSFTYVELIDATNYLNHYYLVCLLAFILIFLPANASFSLDALRKPSIQCKTIPAWCINIIIFQLALVYTCAGIAKLNSDWLFHAMPLAIWLPEHQGFPVFGYFFQFKETAFFFSWVTAFYDLTIAWFLLNKKTRPFAYFMVLAFHILTGMLFNIGLFPLIMISSTLIFFSAEFHNKLLSFFGYKNESSYSYSFPKFNQKIFRPIFAAFVIVQLLVPFRHYLYEGDLMWTEEGYRFSWRVMLVEKNGMATFTVEDTETGRKEEVVNGKYLTQFQEKQMAIQPEFILQFAHFLKKEYEYKYNLKDPIVRVESHVALNGRISQRFIDPQINLAELENSFLKKEWLLSY